MKDTEKDKRAVIRTFLHARREHIDWKQLHHFIKKEGNVGKDVYYSLIDKVVEYILQPNNKPIKPLPSQNGGFRLFILEIA